MKRIVRLVSFIVVLAIILANTNNAFAAPFSANGCDIQRFWISPSGPNFAYDQVITVSVESTCGTNKFYIDNPDRSFYELGTTNISTNINTKDIGSGSHNICVLSRGDGGWDKANNQCISITIGNGSSSGSSDSTSNSSCRINNFSISNTNPNPGDTINFNASGDCDGGPRATKYTIDGQSYSEFGGPNNNTSWNTSGYGSGNHEICFLAVKGDWSSAAKMCKTVTIGGSNSNSGSSSGSGSCWVNSFSVSPKSANVGDTISFSGSGDCSDGGPRAVKFTVDGESKDELGAPSLSGTWNTSGSYNGSHKVCFLVVKSNDWSTAAADCKNVMLGSGSSSSNDDSGSCYNELEFVEDVSVPDNSELLPNQSFTKTWRVKNVGNCAWSANYHFVYISGDRMGGQSVELGKTVNPGKKVDISVDMKAPTQTGSYKGYWLLEDENGSDMKEKVYVKIKVVSSLSFVPPHDPPNSSNDDSSRMGIDVLSYCQAKGYSEAFPNKNHDANSWICAKSGDQTFVDMNTVCQYQFGGTYTASYENASDPYSWHCNEGAVNNSVDPNDPANLGAEGDAVKYCSPQCVKLIREEIDNTKDWLSGTTPSQWYKELSSYRGKYYYFNGADGKRYRVYIKADNEDPEASNIVIYNSNCANESGAVGHTGRVFSFEKGVMLLRDYNADNKCSYARNRIANIDRSCMLFVDPWTREVIKKGDPEPEYPEINIEATATYTEYDNDLQKWFCENLGISCPAPKPLP